MKRLIGLAVAVAVCGLFWVGCQKKAMEPTPAPGAKPEAAQPMTPPPPPPPPPPAPAPAAPTGEQGGGQ